MSLIVQSLEAFKTSGLFPSVPGDELVADAIRGELEALGESQRWILEQRVHRLLEPLGVTAERVGRVRHELAAAGDVTQGPSGWVARAPLRAVSTWDGHLLVGSVTTAALRRFAPDLETRGCLRRAPVGAPVEPVVAAFQGLVVTHERWSGLDQYPPWREWVTVLAERLSDPRKDERAARFVWDDVAAYQGSGRWRAAADGPEPKLLRARQPGGWWAHAWGLSPANPKGLLLISGDEAARTRLAIDAGASTVAPIASESVEAYVQLELPRVPYAECRFLLAQGAIPSEGRTLKVPAKVWAPAQALLQERLGLTFA